jgi:hypothetical protein
MSRSKKPARVKPVAVAVENTAVTDQPPTQAIAPPPVKSNGVALYYPYIHIQDPNWLKMALLYWDGIRTIVPEHSFFDDDETCRAVVEAGLLWATSPGNYTAGAARRFREFLAGNIQGHGYSSEILTRVVEEARANATLEGVYIEKIDYALAEWFCERHLADRSGRRMLMSGEVAAAYMACLAAEMSACIGAPIVTDREATAECAQYVAFGRTRRASPAMPFAGRHVILINPPYSKPFPVQARPALEFRLSLDMPNPASLADISFEKILRFRERYADERRMLREHVESILDPVAGMGDVNQQADYFRSQQATLDRAYAAYRKSHERFYVPSAVAPLSLSVPAALGSLAKSMHSLPIDPAPLVAGGVGCLIVAAYAKFLTDRTKAQESPYHYLVAMDRLVPRGRGR